MSKVVLFNDGEGIHHEDFNLAQRHIVRMLTDGLLKHRYWDRGNFNGTAFRPFYDAGVLTGSGTGNRTISATGGAYLWNLGTSNADDQNLIIGQFDTTDFATTLDSATTGSDWRRDICEVKVELDDFDLTNRDFKDAITGALTTSSFNKSHGAVVTVQYIKGVDQTSEALADANEPATTAGFVKIASFLIDNTGTIDNAKNQRLPRARRWWAYRAASRSVHFRKSNQHDHRLEHTHQRWCPSRS